MFNKLTEQQCAALVVAVIAIISMLLLLVVMNLLEMILGTFGIVVLGSVALFLIFRNILTN